MLFELFFVVCYFLFLLCCPWQEPRFIEGIPVSQLYQTSAVLLPSQRKVSHIATRWELKNAWGQFEHFNRRKTILISTKHTEVHPTPISCQCHNAKLLAPYSQLITHNELPQIIIHHPCSNPLPHKSHFFTQDTVNTFRFNHTNAIMLKSWFHTLN